ncbi:hypothetical protein QJU43_05060 [Pasteurella atlantica]|uniref:Uncharacterized protein n=2 Tax=Pasteurellaceae TaxID=712 RepID=A0ACC6HJY4_9PAST|nr:hypothetical protein [Pasteurella atlantica]MDP8034254.1 hypothetical protein [Pasteurella atlantica]MDP8036187.1 hypothetical protein [Pasteurella atlantica]MDP8038137.1 hypothetical protein [Pasteurella atlantica]MDP8048492.1 hypothetical protein [Pasteurella atlantica]MDP8050443.1 hypothetical protein [Pasteurella atlantica]
MKEIILYLLLLINLALIGNAFFIEKYFSKWNKKLYCYLGVTLLNSIILTYGAEEQYLFGGIPIDNWLIEIFIPIFVYLLCISLVMMFISSKLYSAIKSYIPFTFVFIFSLFFVLFFTMIVLISLFTS